LAVAFTKRPESPLRRRRLPRRKLPEPGIPAGRGQPSTLSNICKPGPSRARKAPPEFRSGNRGSRRPPPQPARDGKMPRRPRKTGQQRRAASVLKWRTGSGRARARNRICVSRFPHSTGSDV
jgi:hypothetical protein